MLRSYMIKNRTYQGLGPSTDGEDLKLIEKAKLDEVTIEIYEAKVRDLAEKLER